MHWHLHTRPSKASFLSETCVCHLLSLCLCLFTGQGLLTLIFTLLGPPITHILSNIKFAFYDDSNKLALAHKPDGSYFGGNLIYP